MPSCAIKICKNYASNNKKSSGVTYHVFPRDPIIFDRWCRIVRQSRGEAYWKAHNKSLICSNHFEINDIYETKGGRSRVRKGAFPKKNLYISSIPEQILEIDTVNSTSSSFFSQNNTLIAKNTNLDSSYSVVEGNFTELCDDRISDYSDIESVFDTSMELYLKKILMKREKLQKKHQCLIKSLRTKNSRLIKKQTRLKEIIKTLKNRRNTNNHRRQLRPSVRIAKEKFQLTLDVRNFRKEEITVKASPEYVIIEGKRERKTNNEYIMRHFVRKFKLPSGCDLAQMQSYLSEDGLLTVCAPRASCDTNLPCDRLVPITHSGPAKTDRRKSTVADVKSEDRCDNK